MLRFGSLAIMTCVAACLVCGTTISTADEFPQFRGPGGRGQIASQNIPVRWSESENLAWKVEVPGTGWSQPVLWNGRLYVTSAVSSMDLRPKNFSAGARQLQSMGLGGLARPPDTEIEWQVLCYQAATGALLWTRTAKQGKPQYPVHPSNTFATETPVADQDGVYAFFGATGTVAAFSHDGEPRWSCELGAFPTSNGFGTGSSLAIDQGIVFVQHFTEGSSLVAARSTRDGSELWRDERVDRDSSWSSPIIWRNDRRIELIVSGGKRMDSYDPASGKKWWTLTRVKAPTACSVASDEKRIYFGGSDPFSKGPLFAMRAGGSGDLSPEDENSEFENCDWLENRAGPGMPSPVSSGDHVYVIDGSVLRCYSAETGERVFQERLPDVKTIAASPLIVGDKLLVIDETGTAVLVRTGSKMEVIGGGKIDDTFWATPAVGENAIYFRGIRGLYCVRSP